MSRMLAAAAALIALAVPATANAAPTADAPKTLKATPATCAFEGYSTCPARRTKLFQFWGKAVETNDDTRGIEVDLNGFGHTGRLRTALLKRLDDTADVRLNVKTKIRKIGFEGGNTKISEAALLEILDEYPRATLYVDGRIWGGSSWADDEPVLRAVRIVVDLSDLPRPAAGQGLKVEYFKNKDLSGSPFAAGIDQQVDFDWSSSAPTALANAGQTDYYGIRWSGSLNAPVAGAYTFRTSSDDGVRLVIDGVTVIDNWTTHAVTNNDMVVNLTAGSHTIELRYYENAGVSVARLWWQTPGSPGFAIIPATSLRTS
jgi:hypothetical protein